MTAFGAARAAAPPCTLRPARPEDADACAAILMAWIAETPWMPRLHAPSGYRSFCARLIEEQDVTVAWSDRVDGFLALGGDVVWALHLSAEARRRGMGAALLDAAKAKTPRLSLWTFQANEAARRFYAREGFREAQLTDGSGNDEGLPDVLLVWERT